MADLQPATRVRSHVRALVRLAVPVVIARSGIMAMAVVDTVMVGRLSARELAYLGIGLAPITTLLLAMTGLALGTLVVTAAVYGSGRVHECGAVWRRALPFVLVVGAGAAVVCGFGEQLLTLFGQSRELAAEGGAVVRVLGLGLGPALVFLASTFFLEGINRPLPGMVAMVIANLLNVLLNWAWVYGHFGFPAMGAVGSAWATTAVRAFLAVALVAYIWWMADHPRFGVRPRPRGGWHSWAAQRRIGYAAGASIGVEAAAFSILAVLAGWLGPEPLASFSIALNVLSVVFMVAVGLGSATAVRVGIAHGSGDARDTAWAGWTGLAVNTALMGAFGIVLVRFAPTISAAYTTDPALITATAPVIALCAWVLIADGGQGVMANALRGRGETWVATGLHVVSYLVVMTPLAWYLAFPAGRGVRGLFEAVLIASIVSISLLSVRFHRLAVSDRRRTPCASDGGG